MLKLEGILESFKEALEVESLRGKIFWSVGRKEKVIVFCQTFPEYQQEILKSVGFSEEEYNRFEELYTKHGVCGLQVTKRRK